MFSLFSCQVESQANVNHFGRSLLGGYCPQYMPDFVLHGISSDVRLKQCLMADLEHTVLVSKKYENYNMNEYSTCLVYIECQNQLFE